MQGVSQEKDCAYFLGEGGLGLIQPITISKPDTAQESLSCPPRDPASTHPTFAKRDVPPPLPHAAEAPPTRTAEGFIPGLALHLAQGQTGQAPGCTSPGACGFAKATSQMEMQTV